MDLLVEVLMELLLEGAIELGGSKKAPKWLRYPAAAAVILFFTAIIGLLFFSAYSLRDHRLASLFLLAVGLFLLAGSLIKFRKYALQIKEKSKGCRTNGNNADH